MTNSMTNENKQKIEMGKEYSSYGKKQRVLCVDSGSDKFPVITVNENGEVGLFTERGTFYSNNNSCFDLVEYSPWQDVAVDTKVLCGVVKGCYTNKRHFAKYEDGRVYVFPDGQTSFTSDYAPASFPYNKLA